LGIDIGGSGIKGAVVDLETGEFVTERHRIATPKPATPAAVADTVNEIVQGFRWSGPIGVGLPSVVQRGVARTAANIDDGWIGADAQALLSEVTGCPARVLNDADAAGLAEFRYGAGRHTEGVVLLLTLGTGIGSALFSDGVLVPNTELGHLIIDGVEAEHFASDGVRKREGLDWPTWSARLSHVLQHYHRLWWPDLIILGGGVSKRHAHFVHLLEVDAPIVPAQLQNRAGIVGAAAAVA